MKKLLTILCGISLAIMISANASALQLIQNGGFDQGFAGWEVQNLSTEGGWVINEGLVPLPPNGNTIPPISPDFDAATATLSPPAPGDPIIPNRNFLSQSFLVPVGITSAALSWYYRIENYPIDPATNKPDPNGDYITGMQEFRVDILDSTDTIVKPIFSTQPGDPLIQRGPIYRDSDLLDLLLAYGGNYLTLRFLEIDTVGPFIAVVDDISLVYDTTPVPEPATVLLLSAGLFGLAGYGRKRLQSG